MRKSARLWRGTLKTIIPLFIAITVIPFLPTSLNAAENILLAQKGSRATAKKHFENGTKAFDEGDFKIALEEFQEAYNTKPHPMVLVNIANCYARLMEPVKAVEHFELFLKEAADTASEEQLEAARRELKKQRRFVGRLKIIGVPEDSAVIVDGDKKGYAPLKKSILAKSGPHVIIIRTKNKEEMEKVAEVSAEEETTVNFGKKEAPPPPPPPVEEPLFDEEPSEEPVIEEGEIKVNSTAEGSTVTVNGEEVGATPWSEMLEPGDYVLRVENEGYSPWEERISIVNGMTQTVDVSLVEGDQEPDLLPFWITIGVTGAFAATSVGLGIASAWYGASASNYEDWLLDSERMGTVGYSGLEELNVTCEDQRVPKGFPKVCENNFLRKDYEIKHDNLMYAAIAAGGLAVVGGGLAAYFWFFPPGAEESNAEIWLAPIVDDSMSGVTASARF